LRGADAGEELFGGFEGAGLLASEIGLGWHELAVEGFGEGSAVGRCGGDVSPRPEDTSRPEKVGSSVGPVLICRIARCAVSIRIVGAVRAVPVFCPNDTLVPMSIEFTPGQSW
jgi:hypothetical protein